MISTAHARDIAFIERQLLISIVAMSAWGGCVRFIMLKKFQKPIATIIGLFCQITMSCFSGVLLSIYVLSRNASDDKVLIVAGLGGVFAGPIINIIGKKISYWIDNITPPPKE